MKPLLILIATLPMFAEHPAREWKWSAAAVAGASFADAATSFRGYELNPVLRGSDGRFGTRGIAIKGGVVAGMLLAQRTVGRRNPRAYRVFAKVNWVVAGVTSGVAVRNTRVR